MMLNKSNYVLLKYFVEDFEKSLKARSWKSCLPYFSLHLGSFGGFWETIKPILFISISMLGLFINIYSLCHITESSMCIITQSFNDCIEILELRKGKVSSDMVKCFINATFCLPAREGQIFDEVVVYDCGWQNLVTSFIC